MIHLANTLANNGVSKAKTEKNSRIRKNLSSKTIGTDKIQIDSIVEIQNQLEVDSIFELELSLLSQESNHVFNFLKELRLQIIDNQINPVLAEEIKDKILKNKHKYTNDSISDLAEDIILRLEIEIAKLELSKNKDSDYTASDEKTE
jgi:hypothetical protein